MFTLLRWMFRLAMLLVLLLAVAWFSAGALVKYAVERQGAALLGAHVSVGAVRLALLSGEADVAGLLIGNPAGFSAAPAFRLDRLRVVVDLPSLLGSPVRLREVVVSGAGLRLEAGKAGVNLLALAKRARGDAPAKRPGERLFLLDRFEFTGGRLEAGVGAAGNANADLPPVRLTGIGRKSGGETLRELVASLIESVSREAATPDRVGRLEDRLKGVLEERVRKAGRKAEDRLRKLFR